MVVAMNNHDQLAALEEIAGRLRAEDIPYSLFGGWAVDFHIGRITRAHADIDIAVWAHDQPRLAALLIATTWRHRPDPDEDGYTCYQRGNLRLEVAFIARDAEGQIYTPLRSGRGEWPSDSFGDAVGQVEGVRARVVSLASLLADKSVPRADPTTREKDRADVASLRQRSEATVPPQPNER